MRFCSPCESVCVSFVHVSIISFVVVYELANGIEIILGHKDDNRIRELSRFVL